MRHRGRAQGPSTPCELSLLVTEVATRLRTGAPTSLAWGFALARIDAGGSVGVDNSYPAVLDKWARAPMRWRSLRRAERIPGVAASRVSVASVVLACRFSHDLGAPLADMLDAIGSAIDDARALEEAYHVAAASLLMSTCVLAALPLVGIACALTLGASPWQLYMGGIVGRMCAFVGGIMWAADVTSCRRILAWCRRVEEGIDGAFACDPVASALAYGTAIPRALDALVDASTTEALTWATASLRLGATWADVWEDTPEWSHPLHDALEASWTSGTALETLLVRSVARERRSRLVDAETRAGELDVRLVGLLGVFFLPAFLFLGIAPLLTHLVGGIGV